MPFETICHGISVSSLRPDRFPDLTAWLFRNKNIIRKRPIEIEIRNPSRIDVSLESQSIWINRGSIHGETYENDETIEHRRIGSRIGKKNGGGGGGGGRQDWPVTRELWRESDSWNVHAHPVITPTGPLRRLISLCFSLSLLHSFSLKPGSRYL
jgi:hypothetical protein